MTATGFGGATSDGRGQRTSSKDSSLHLLSSEGGTQHNVTVAVSMLSDGRALG